ncbi:hypothetical protein GEV43_42005 [Actinomadura sp. J1-007]|nr:hypothetical protein [Actinomadura sp. J1-007]
MGEQPQDAGFGNDRPPAEGDRSGQEPTAPAGKRPGLPRPTLPTDPQAERQAAPGESSGVAALWATRRRLLLGVGGLLVAAAVPAGILAARDRSALRALGTLQHGNVISALSFSPDGKTLASTETGGGAVRVWDVADRKERARTVPSSMVFTLAFSPDGRTLTTGGIEGAQFWDAATLNLLGEITSPGGTPEETFVTIAFSPNGRSFAASGFDDNQIRFYNPDTRELDGPPLPGAAPPPWRSAGTAAHSSATISPSREATPTAAMFSIRAACCSGTWPPASCVSCSHSTSPWVPRTSCSARTAPWSPPASALRPTTSASSGPPQATRSFKRWAATAAPLPAWRTATTATPSWSPTGRTCTSGTRPPSPSGTPSPFQRPRPPRGGSTTGPPPSPETEPSACSPKAPTATLWPPPTPRTPSPSGTWGEPVRRAAY